MIRRKLSGYDLFGWVGNIDGFAIAFCTKVKNKWIYRGAVQFTFLFSWKSCHEYSYNEPMLITEHISSVQQFDNDE